MTALPEVRLDVQPPWYSLPRKAGQAASEPVAAAVWAATGTAPGRTELGVLAGLLEQVDALSKDHPLVGAYVLVPDPESGPLAVCRAARIELDRDCSMDELIAESLPPAERRVGAVATTPVETPAGTAYRLTFQQRGSDGKSVLDATFQLLHLPEERLVVSLDVGFTDVVEARRWEAEVATLFDSLTLVRRPEPGPVTTVRPEVPDFRANRVKLLTDHGPGLRAASITVDRARDVVELHDERVGTTTQVMPLDAVAGVLRVTWEGISRYSLWGRMLVVGHDGRVLAQTKVTMLQIFQLTWTEDAVSPLPLRLPDETYKSSRRLQRAHPGAAPHWYFTTWPWSVLIIFAAILLVLVVVFLATEGLG